MLHNKSGMISAIVISLMLVGSLTILAQDAGDSDPGRDVSFEVTKTHMGDVLDIKIADIDGDNTADIIYAGLMNGDLHIMFGIKEGGFEAPVVYPIGAKVMSIAYFNNDMLPDIVCAYMYEINFCINNGDRTFTINTATREYTNLGGVATGFFNDDSHLDVIAAYRYIYYGDGEGNFPDVVTLPLWFQTVFVSDFNNDGSDDFVAIDHNGRSGIYLNDKNGNFNKSADFDLGGLTLGVSIDNPFADFNRDGNADFAFITPMGMQPSFSKITIGYGDGNGGILNMTYKLVPKTAYCMSIADVDRDNYLDLIASNASDAILEVFLGSEESVFSDAYHIDLKTDSITHAIATGDLNRDGNPDFVSGAFNADSIALIMNQNLAVPVLSDPMITTGYSNVGIEIVNPTGFELSRNYKTVAGAVYWRQDIDLDNSIDVRAIDYNLQYGEYKIVIKPKPDASLGSEFSTTINIGQDEMVLFKDYEIPVSSRGAAEPIVFYYTVEAVSSMQPANGSSVATTTPMFDWSGLVEHIPGVSNYIFEVDRYYDFRSPLIAESNLDLAQYTPDMPLAVNDVYYWRFKSFDGAEWSEYSRTMAVNIVEFICGDVDGLAGINILDIIFLINYKYKDGPAPEPLESGDVDGVMPINILDAVYLINAIYKGGPAPMCQ